MEKIEIVGREQREIVELDTVESLLSLSDGSVLAVRTHRQEARVSVLPPSIYIILIEMEKLREFGVDPYSIMMFYSKLIN